jgi:thiol-disulfide isomerase/thioredoxin
MKRVRLSFVLAALVGTAFANSVPAAEAKLKIGDPAPKLQMAKWVQGEPVKEFDTNHVYIVEFWATWCVPCRVSIPHLNDLYQKFKDKGLVVIGQNVLEPNDDDVAAFVKMMDGKMAYPVALDDKSQNKEGAMQTTWLKATTQLGIPTVFIVNRQGLIAWIGYPMGPDGDWRVNEKLVADILSGHYDLAKAAADYEVQQREQENQQKLMELSDRLHENLALQNWNEAETNVADLQRLLPAGEREGLVGARFQILLGRKDYTAGYKLVSSLSDAHPDDAVLQNELAWFIAAKPGLEERDLVLAEKMAGRANQATQGKEAGVLETLARVQFMSGKTNEAVATEQKAVNLTEGPVKEHLQQSLTSYQQGKLPE